MYLVWETDLVFGNKSFWAVNLGFGFTLTFWLSVSIILSNLTPSPKQIPNLWNILLSVRSVFMCSNAKPSTFSATEHKDKQLSMYNSFLWARIIFSRESFI